MNLLPLPKPFAKLHHDDGYFTMPARDEKMGHVDVQMVFRIYGKFIAQDFQKPMPRLRVVGD